MGGPKIKTYCPSLTRAQMYTPGIGLRLGMERIQSAPPTTDVVYLAPDGAAVFLAPDGASVYIAP